VNQAERRRLVVAAGHDADPETARAALADPDALTRSYAISALARTGHLGDHDLVAALGDPAPDVRRRAVELAAGRPGVDLLGVLHDADVIVRESAAWACGEHEQVSDEILERLIELAVADDAALVREAAVAALGAIGDERGRQAILAGCTDIPAIRRRAVLALAPFDGDDVDTAIDLALTDRDWQVRQAAEDLRRVDPREADGSAAASSGPPEG
jgi:hypothetical protein